MRSYDMNWTDRLAGFWRGRLGLVIDKVTGHPLGRELTDRIFAAGWSPPPETSPARIRNLV